MGLTAAFNNALSGLTANAWATDVIASNVANAQTEGYGPRRLELAARLLGGVQVKGELREVDLALLNDVRAAGASVAGNTTAADFWRQLEQAIGEPGDAGSLGNTISGLNSSLIQAAGQPESEAALSGVLDAAKALAGKINTISNGIEAARTGADASIGSQVDRLNAALNKVADLNAEIQAQVINGGQPSGLMDARQRVIDDISGIVPLRQVARENGKVALVTTGGALLLEGSRPVEVGFSAVGGPVTADMTLGSGALSGLTLAGIPVSAGGPMFAGGSLAATFAVRDTVAPEAQAKLDGLARDLAARFEASVDPTLGPTDPGLFTDAGIQVDASNETGLASRLAVNVAADPAAGGALWHLRDGLAAALPGNTGDGSILTAMADALSALQVPASGGITTGAADVSGLAGQILSQVSTARLAAENGEAYANARASALDERAKKAGVDTDQQMQQLLLVEKSYAANARVISVADGMLQSILEI